MLLCASSYKNNTYLCNSNANFIVMTICLLECIGNTMTFRKSRLLTSNVFTAIIYLCLVSLTSACNDDVFIENTDLPEYSEITISGDDGYWSRAYNRKGLERIYFSFSEGKKEYVRYFDVKGDEVDSNCPASELRNILYEDPFQYYDIGFHGDMIYVNTYYNSTRKDNYLTLLFEYDYGLTKEISINITPGEPYWLFPNYEGEMVLEENIDELSFRQSFVNKGHVPQRMEVYPYRSSRCSAIVTMERDWSKGLVVDMALPTFDGSEWILREYSEVALGEYQSFDFPDNTSEKISVEVPANSKCTVTYTLHYTRAVQKGFMLVHTSGFQMEEEFTCTSVYPTNYDYTVSYE